MSQLSFLQIAQGKKRLRCERFLEEMKQVVPWAELGDLIAPYYESKASTGRKKKELGLMLKIICLQQWYGLSDPGVEEAIYDRNSFQKFLELNLLRDVVPDETTILNFRHLLEEHDLFAGIFEAIGSHIEDKGLLMKRGTLVDATLIAAPCSTKNKDKKRDPEMSSTKKGNDWHFGMKAHIGVDADTGLVHSMTASTARVHDSVEMNGLLHGDEKLIGGDKGYASDERKREMRGDGIAYAILDKAKRGKKLSSSQNRRNKKMSSLRAKVEHPFQVIKCQWGYRKTRYRGISKNQGQLYLLFALANLFMSRKKLLAIV